MGLLLGIYGVTKYVQLFKNFKYLFWISSYIVYQFAHYNCDTLQKVLRSKVQVNNTRD